MPHDGLTLPQPAMGSTEQAYYPGEEVTASNSLFRPYQMGPFSLPHRIAMAPLTRQRAIGQVPQPSAIKMYNDRATGGFIISEATAVSVEGHGYPHVPGIHTQEQIEAWKPIVKAVHDKGSPFFLQIWHAGRTSHTDYQPNGAAPVSSTSKGITTGQVTTEKGVHDYATSTPPRALETHEIPGIVEQFRTAARNAIEAGFDGVEIHGAHGYLIDQFLKDNINDRSDKYGGSIENRSRLALEVAKAVADEVGPDRVGIRLSPYTDLYAATDSNPNALMAYIIPKLNDLNLLYLHIMEPRIGPGLAHQEVDESEKSLKPFRKMFKNTFIVAGGYTRQNGMEVIDAGDADLVAYGRSFIANPDLVKRIALDLPLNAYDRSTFYSQEQVKGYNDYPFYEEIKGNKAQATLL